MNFSCFKPYPNYDLLMALHDEIMTMAELNRSELLCEIESLQERIREQDHQLARFKRTAERSALQPKGGVRATSRKKGAASVPVEKQDAEAAAAGNRIAKHWAGIYAHELNQPLAAALASAQGCRGLLNQRKMQPAELVDVLDGLIRRVQLAADIVRRLRALAGGEPPRRLPTDLRDVVRRAFDVLQSLLDDSHVSVKLDFAADFPNLRIDAVQIVQVVVNLVRNGIEAMSSVPASRRQLTVRAQFDSREATIAVVDRGVGMSIEAIQRLFQPVASTKPAGMGLGLALCRQIVEAQGGRIWANVNSPNGCTFSFSFPLEFEEP